MAFSAFFHQYWQERTAKAAPASVVAPPSPPLPAPMTVHAEPVMEKQYATATNPIQETYYTPSQHTEAVYPSGESSPATITVRDI
jgi:hypothetical protein